MFTNILQKVYKVLNLFIYQTIYCHSRIEMSEKLHRLSDVRDFYSSSEMKQCF